MLLLLLCSEENILWPHSHLSAESNVFMCHIHTQKPKMILLYGCWTTPITIYLQRSLIFTMNCPFQRQQQQKNDFGWIWCVAMNSLLYISVLVIRIRVSLVNIDLCAFTLVFELNLEIVEVHFILGFLFHVRLYLYRFVFSCSSICVFHSDLGIKHTMSLFPFECGCQAIVAEFRNIFSRTTQLALWRSIYILSSANKPLRPTKM